jgi:hypothetical protein
MATMDSDSGHSDLMDRLVRMVSGAAECQTDRRRAARTLAAKVRPDQPLSAASTSSSIFLASPKSMRLLSL